MKTWQIGSAVALGLGVLAGGAHFQPAASAEVSWISDPETAARTARETGKPIFAAFR